MPSYARIANTCIIFFVKFGIKINMNDHVTYKDITITKSKNCNQTQDYYGII